MPFEIRPTRLDDAPRLPAIERSASCLFTTISDLAWIADANDMPAGSIGTLRDVTAQRAMAEEIGEPDIHHHLGEGADEPDHRAP